MSNVEEEDGDSSIRGQRLTSNYSLRWIVLFHLGIDSLPFTELQIKYSLEFAIQITVHLEFLIKTIVATLSLFKDCRRNFREFLLKDSIEQHSSDSTFTRVIQIGSSRNYHANDPQSLSTKLGSTFTPCNSCRLDIACSEEEDTEGVRMGSRRSCMAEFSVKRLS